MSDEPVRGLELVVRGRCYCSWNVMWADGENVRPTTEYVSRGDMFSGVRFSRRIR